MSPSPAILVAPATTEPDWQRVRELFRDYARSLDVDLAFQGFEAELAGLPGAYAAPRGIVLLAWVDGAAAACGAVRPRDDLPYRAACEMKRLFVRAEFRGLGLGRRIAEGLMAHARAAGHATMLLDTLASMAAARQLYGALGFVDVPAYYANPLPGVGYLSASL